MKTAEVTATLECALQASGLDKASIVYRICIDRFLRWHGFLLIVAFRKAAMS
jgi:hypothetical protein